MTPIEALADSVLDGIKVYVEKKTAPMAAKIAELEAKLAAIPPPQAIDPIALAEAVTARCLEAIPAPKDGSDGAPGKDADPVDMDALARLVNEAVGGAMAAVKVPEDGKDGKDGHDGLDGKNGAEGKSVEISDLAPMVAKAVGETVALLPPAKDGRDGQDGQNGEPGPAGRDASQLDILPTIEATKEYHAGTWAKFNGGILRSFRNTKPRSAVETLEAAGWEVMIDGVASVVPEFDGSRNFTTKTIYTSGNIEEVKWHLPIPYYRGVHKHGEGYEHGDMVTSDGSTWFALKDTDSIPGASADWRLAVKRGRDGKDGEMKLGTKVEPVRLK